MFFAISGIYLKEEAIQRIKDAIVKSYSHKGEKIVQMNFKAVDNSLANLEQVDYPKEATSERHLETAMHNAPDGFVTEVLKKY